MCSCIHNYHRRTSGTAFVSVASPVVLLTVILHHFQHLHLLWAKTHARVVNGDMWICGRSRVELIEQHASSTMTGGSLLLYVEAGWAPREVGANGFHSASGQRCLVIFTVVVLQWSFKHSTFAVNGFIADSWFWFVNQDQGLSEGPSFLFSFAQNITGTFKETENYELDRWRPLVSEGLKGNERKISSFLLWNESDRFKDHCGLRGECL